MSKQIKKTHKYNKKIKLSINKKIIDSNFKKIFQIYFRRKKK
jgi:hypothetical protein